MRRILLGAAMAAGCAGSQAADPPAPQPGIAGVGGMAFGDSWRGRDGLLPAAWHGSESPGERVFYLADAVQRHTLGGVQLDWPGLLYRFHDDRLYAVEGEFSGTEQSFAQLEAHFTTRHGAPHISQSWHTAPEETYVHRARLRSVAWYSADGRRSIWLMRDDARGYLVALDRGERAGGGQPVGEFAGSESGR